MSKCSLALIQDDNLIPDSIPHKKWKLARLVTICLLSLFLSFLNLDSVVGWINQERK